MKIGIDGYEANVTKRVGIGQYAYQLLLQFAASDVSHEFTIFLPSPPLGDMPEERPGWKYVVGRLQSFWTVRQLPFLIKKTQLDLFFSPTHYLPWFTKIPKILSIMDLSYLHYPQLFRKKDVLQLKYMGQYSIKRAHKIITISEFTKQEISKYYGYPEAKITVTYPGLTASVQKQQDETQVLARYGISKPFILFVGTLQPRKNIVRLIQAFNDIANVDLVIVGKKGWLFEPILHAIENSPKKASIHWLDYVPGEELPVLFKHARVFTLPSLYEGFGIPVLEAMHYGCPVVVARSSSLPEVAGEAGIYIDPLSVTSLAEGLKRGVQLTDEARRELVSIGLAQSKKFTWENCARKTLAVFEELK